MTALQLDIDGQPTPVDARPPRARRPVGFARRPDDGDNPWNGRAGRQLAVDLKRAAAVLARMEG